MRLLLLSGFAFFTLQALAQTPRPARPAKTTKTIKSTRPARSASAGKPAQPARPAVVYKDVLYKLDKSSLTVKIGELTETGVVYFDPASPGVKQTLPRTQVWKVVFSDGSVEAITPLPEDMPVAAPAPSGTGTAPATQQAEYTRPGATARYRPVQDFGRLHITIGPEFAYYPAFLNTNKSWLNDSTGFGMKQNIGASLRVDYQFLRPLAVSITAGYYGWELVRKYTRDGLAEYSETKKLTQIPLQIGLKIYPISGLYLMPEGGTTLLFSSITTSEGHPTPANESVNSTPITYGGSVGYEIRAKALLLDLSLRYQLLNVKNLNFTEFQQRLSEQVSIASLRVGIGFSSPKK